MTIQCPKSSYCHDKINGSNRLHWNAIQIYSDQQNSNKKQSQLAWVAIGAWGLDPIAPQLLTPAVNTNCLQVQPCIPQGTTWYMLLIDYIATFEFLLFDDRSKLIPWSFYIDWWWWYCQFHGYSELLSFCVEQRSSAYFCISSFPLFVDCLLIRRWELQFGHIDQCKSKLLQYLAWPCSLLLACCIILPQTRCNQRQNQNNPASSSHQYHPSYPTHPAMPASLLSLVVDTDTVGSSSFTALKRHRLFLFHYRLAFKPAWHCCYH